MSKRSSIIIGKLRKRLKIYLIVLFILVLLLVFTSEYWLYVGFDVKQEEAIISNIKESTPTSYSNIVLFIFSNNYLIALSFLIPVLGIINMVEVMSETSKIFSTYALEVSNYTEISPFLISAFLVFFTIFNPFSYFFGILEFLGYSLTVAQGIYLIISIIIAISRKNVKEFSNELIYTLFIIFLSAIVLLAAASLEALAII